MFQSETLYLLYLVLKNLIMHRGLSRLDFILKSIVAKTGRKDEEQFRMALLPLFQGDKITNNSDSDWNRNSSQFQKC